MAMFAGLRKAFALEPLQYEAKQSATTAAIVDIYGPGQPVYTPRDFGRLAAAGFGVNVYVYRAVMAIAQAMAGIKWQLKDGDNAVTAHPLLDRWAHPNPEQGTAQFVEELVAFWLLAGNSYVEAVRRKTDNTPLELWVLRPDRVRVIPDAKQRVGGFEYRIGAKVVTWNNPQDIFHLKMFAAMDDWYGLSPIVVAAKSIDQMNAANDWNTALLQNLAVPSGALVTPGSLNPKQKNDLRTAIRERFSGAKNARVPMLLEAGLDWKQFGLTPNDMDWLTGKKENAKEIAIAFGVPPEMLGDSANKTYSNYQEARASFYTETVLPLMDRLADRLNNWLVPMYVRPGQRTGLRFEYDRNDIEALQEDRQAVWTRVDKGWNSGWIKRSEAREAVGLPVGPEDDVYKSMPGNANAPNAQDGATNPQDVPTNADGGQGGPSARTTPNTGTDDTGDATVTDDGASGGAKLRLSFIPKMLAETA